MQRKRVLFFSETVTLAHICRPMKLAQSLDLNEWDVTIASGKIPEMFKAQMTSFRHITLETAVPSPEFLAAIDSGKLPYTVEVLRRQVQEDLALISEIKPDVVVGDFRLSLAISARVARVPYINISNITWSPYAKQEVQVPDMPIVRLVGERLAKWIFTLIKPLIYRKLASPFNQVAREYGRPALGKLFEIYTAGDRTLFSDVPGLVPTPGAPASTITCGSIDYSTPADVPSWFNQIKADRPCIYLSLGSSGNARLLPEICSALADLPVYAIVSVTGQAAELPSAPNIFIANYVPAESVLQKCSLMISNGGSASSYVALSLGVPVLAIPSNLDQFQYSQAICNRGVALRLRPEQVTKKNVSKSVLELLSSPAFRANAQAMKSELTQVNPGRLFSELAATVVSRPLIERPQSFSELFDLRLAKTPSAVAFETQTQSITWKQFHQTIHQVAQGLSRLGLKVGDGVAVLSANCPEWEAVFYGAILNQGYVVGIDLMASAAQKARMLEDSGARVLVVDRLSRVKDLPTALLAKFAATVVLHELPGTSAAKVIAWEHLLVPTQAPSQIPASRSDAPALLIYTSGSTGQPRGIVYSQAQVLSAAWAIIETLGGGKPNDYFLSWLPVSQTFQRMMNICAICVGAPTAILGEPQQIMTALRRHRPTILAAPPRLFEKVADQFSARLKLLPSWARKLAIPAARFALTRVLGGHLRLLLSGSAPLPARVDDFFTQMKMPIFNAYGLSENIFPIAMNQPGRHRTATVGAVLKENALRFTEEGEILVKSFGLGRPHNSAAASLTDAEGFYHTGDLGEYTDEGLLVLTGRKADLIKTSSGSRISPLIIESALKQVPEISHAFVSGHGRLGLVALLTLKDNALSTRPERLADLRRHLWESMINLAPYERVHAMVILRADFTIENGLLTPNLKMRRSAIEKTYALNIDHLHESTAAVHKADRDTADLPLVLEVHRDLHERKESRMAVSWTAVTDTNAEFEVLDISKSGIRLKASDQAFSDDGLLRIGVTLEDGRIANLEVKRVWSDAGHAGCRIVSSPKLWSDRFN